MADKKDKKKGQTLPPGTIRKPDNFEELEKEFETVLNELLNDESLERFRREYEKLHDALVNSHKSERQLMEKVRELNTEIATNAEKVATALLLSKEDEVTISNLKLDSERAWKMVEYLQEKEAWAKETITALREEIVNLNVLVKKGADLAVQYQASGLSGHRPMRPSGKEGSQTSVNDVAVPRLTQPHADFTADLSTHDESETTRGVVEALKKTIADMEAEKSKQMNEILELISENRNKTLNQHRERTRREKVEVELSAKIADMEEQKMELSDLSRQLDTARHQVTNNETSIRELRVTCEMNCKEIDSLNSRLQKTLADADKQLTVIDSLQMENLELNHGVRMRDEKLSKLSDNLKKTNKAKDVLNRKVKLLTEQRAALRKEKEQLNGQLYSAEKIIEGNRKNNEADKKHISNLMRERDVVNKNLIKQVHATERQTNLVSLHEQTNRNMGQEIMGFRKESEKQRRIILQLEQERDRYINENGNLTVKVMKGMEECQVRDLQILDYQKQVEELESRQKIQQNMYEAVHQDRNMYSRQLIETQDEMNEMKNKLRMLEHQSNQLKEEVAAREAAVVKEHLECLRLEKERDSLQGEIQMLKNQLRNVEQIIQDLRAEEKNLQKVIAASDELIKRQKRELDTIISERDILGSQLVRRNDELSLIYQKVNLLQTLINNGNRMYDQRIEDIRLLRLEMRRQRHENCCLKKSVTNVTSYKQELYNVHRELLHERARCAALENELSHPRQVHRWRGLEVSDPSKFELLQKVQALQKRLIGRTEEVVEVERVLQEKDRLYLELRTVLERQPGPEVTKQLAAYQRVIKDKNRQLKSLAAELNMFECENKRDEYGKQKMEQQMMEMKKKYFKEKKRRQDTEELKTLRKTLPAIKTQYRFTGGGFRVSSKTL